jgi:hypothetical protein
MPISTECASDDHSLCRERSCMCLCHNDVFDSIETRDDSPDWTIS